jgi:hypothetical protein
MDCHKLSWYVLEDVLGCPVGCCLLICFFAGANGDSTEVLYCDQAKNITKRRNKRNINIKCWRMAGNHVIVMQGRIVQMTLHNENNTPISYLGVISRNTLTTVVETLVSRSMC